MQQILAGRDCRRTAGGPVLPATDCVVATHGVRRPAPWAILADVAVFAVLVLVAPLLVLASVIATLWTYGPLGWLASVLLVAGLARGCTWSCRATARWWRSTKAPERVPVRPADRRR